MLSVSLTHHPTTPCPHVRALGVRVDRVSEHGLALHYRVEGDLDELRWPASRASAHTDGLWQHTCFEAFVKHGDSRAYLELNFSPSSEWAIYGFADYRCGKEVRKPEHPPEIAAERQGEEFFEVAVTVHLKNLLLEPPPRDRLRLSLAAVLEDRHGALSYWALAHPSERPDFHHADSFI